MSKEILFYKATINETQKKLVNEVLTDDAGLDCKVRVLEEAMQDITSASYVIAVNNDTSAMHLSLCAIDLKRGDKVLCSVNAFPSVPEVVRHFDAEPVFIDICSDDYNMDLDALEKHLDANNSKKLKAAIITHIAGQPTDLDRLYEIGKKYDVKIIEDATNAMGATYKGEPIGSTGADITIFSFNPHLKHEGAHGGVMVCEDVKIYERAKLLQYHAISNNDESELQLDYIYDVIDIGREYTMSELDAAYCLGALENVASATKRCQAIAAKYMKALEGLNHITLPAVIQDHAFNLFIVKVDKNRDSFARDLEAKGIHTGLHFIPLHLISYYKAKYELRVNAYPIALQTYQQVLSLPIYEALTDAEVDYVCSTVIDLAKDRT